MPMSARRSEQISTRYRLSIIQESAIESTPWLTLSILELHHHLILSGCRSIKEQGGKQNDAANKGQ